MNDDLISREALRKALKANCDTLCNDKDTNWCEHCCPKNDFEDLIDNAPTVDIKPFASFSFDKDELNRIVEERVIEPIKNGELVVETEERPQGEWIDTGNMEEYWEEEYQCSICGAKDHWHHYCPNCGADMQKEVKNETDN